MPNDRPSLTEPHREQLRDFVRLVDEMSRSRFMERYRTQDHTVSCGPREDGQYGVTAPDYDWEDFRSFLTVFRQVAISKDESVHFIKVIQTVGRYASDRLRPELRKMRKFLAPLLEGRYRGLMVGRDLPTGEQSFSTHEILDAIVNGKVFHGDKRHRKTVEFLNASDRWHYLWPLLFEIIIPTLRSFIWLFKAIRQDGILEETDYPAHCWRLKDAGTG